MPFDLGFAQAIVHTMSNAGWVSSPLDDSLPNPLPLEFTKGNQTRLLLIYARQLKPQSSAVSTHNRPVGEFHAQMTFDDSRRGAGIRNNLSFVAETETVLLGFHLMGSNYIVAAYDPQIHKEYAYSKSLQVREHTLEEAMANGLAFHLRTNGEVIVAFHIEEMATYLENANEWHNLTAETIETLQEEVPKKLKSSFEQESSPPPVLEAETRRQRTSEIVRNIRNHRFTVGIRSVYERCAICGFQYDYVLDAAHIVPVAHAGTDTYDNGLGLCPNCHRMFDKGFILVDENMRIYLNPHLLEEYQQIGRADGFERLKDILRDELWLPAESQYYPKPENLRRTFEARNKPKIDF